MKLSREWLNEFTPVSAPDRDFAEAMTLSGSKVEITEVEGAEIENVVVGKVLSLIRHPNSDHMWICQVDIGGAAPIQIVTGAQNVREGDLVPVAKDGSTLPGGVHITAGTLRGEASVGMLCSYKELGMTDHDWPLSIVDGIFILNSDPDLSARDLRPGDDLRAAIGYHDHVVEFEITPNRPDCLSVIGLAREAAATFGTPLTLHTPEVKGGGPGALRDLLDVETPDADLCPRYTARMVRNVKIGPSPLWMRQRLRAMGVRPINNIVDITNYVMLEYGQPMHAFDYRYVKGGRIIVRRAKDGETLTTLDGTPRKLNPSMLVIADAHRAVGLAGIMGGENSEIVDDTVDVVFESANFDGTCIRKGALALGMRTEASAKFEKGLDPMNTLPAVNRACELVELLGAGEVVDGVIDILNHVPQPTVLELEPEKINDLLGTDVSGEEMASILRKLDFQVEGDRITVPSWRGDVLTMADLAEEVARFHGYNRIPVTLMRGTTTQGGYSPAQRLERRLGQTCRSAGYDEIITYSFISPTYYDKIGWAPEDPRRRSLKILNPLGEDTSIMRTTTLPSMLEILARNYNFRNKSARLYELGRIYLPRADGLADEPKVLSLGAYGDIDFFGLKGVVEALLHSIRVGGVSYQACRDNASYHPGRCATVCVGGEQIGVLGQIHPTVCANYGVDTALYCAELSFEALMRFQGPEPEYVPLPKFPSVARDIAVVCDASIPVATLENCISRGARGLLKEVELFDIYTGAPIPAGKKSVAFNLTLRSDERSLTAAEADEDVKSVLELLQKELGAVLR
ncbi:phenylalanine--tRNA ligase subunit beta [Intestinimonas butyriciproducens]|uniref:phenylalanine--tRNA ligase subunit beta n=1 Tax=Intestinimonas butyriciproducens TaxID=1297617 RepID=UPI001899E684|nr:phenylalanine--tRNA ligase subunit beta [Intestinimonas butyriciproducens]MDB7829333.1 phenylalanine--tRNA ligase subunit beta [Intestinimonas butyriciproducens]MDB7860639.1 phenylalanine--tRNA ligase subunit beta [Intestinimonas butyriciproducens]MDB7862801.1 phenylalanine--tRNA ligase subunit beta [Intestinimonas butyriciproducens]